MATAAAHSPHRFFFPEPVREDLQEPPTAEYRISPKAELICRLCGRQVVWAGFRAWPKDCPGKYVPPPAGEP